ncbi:hybrid sensor histidine kinase/response regulator [Desulfonatronum thiodismutans]|uniref:hybrid sensor histidine kinase/response regulator n=1 Tax=Desulfonatronum thiodismutans TaxID=159290 RepID=UPI00068A9D59|nr:PAS domain S-box protein [Desulfonatronum thiodismutans]
MTTPKNQCPEIRTRSGAARQGTGVLISGLSRTCLLVLFFVLLAVPPFSHEVEAETWTDRHSLTDQLLATILQTAPTGIGMVEGRVISSVNDYVLELTGYSREELIGQSARMLYPTQEDYDFVGREKYRQISEKGTGSVETRWLRKDGAVLDVILSSTPLNSEDLSAGVTFTVLDITQRRQSEERFAKAFHSSPAPLVISDIETGLFLDVNERWNEMLGYAREELIGKTSKEVGIWADPADRDRIVAKIAEQGYFKDEPIQFMTKAGEPRYALWSAEVVLLDGRRVMLSLILDETERKLAEAALSARTRIFLGVLTVFTVVLLALVLQMAWNIRQREKMTQALQASEENLATTLHSIGDGVIATDPRGLVTNMNQVAEKLCGWTLDEAKGKPLNEVFRIVNSRTREIVDNPVHQVIDFGRIVGLANHTLLLSRGGVEYQIADSAAPIRDRQGRISGVVLVFRDVTDEYAAEERLRQSEQRFQAFMDETPVYAYIKDESLAHVYKNRRVAELMNGFVSLAGGDSARALFDSATSDLLEKADERILSGELDRVELEYAAHIGEKQRWLNDVKFALVLADGRRAVGGLAYDITERKQAEAEREKMQAQLLQAQKMESVGILAGGVAHDFNNLLQTLGGNIELLLAGKPDDHPDVVRLRAALKSTERAAQLVRQLLLFSRKEESCRVPVDLNREVEGVAGMLRRTIPKMVAVETRLDPELWSLLADPVQIEQVLLNLANNAVDAMPDGGTFLIETNNVVLDEGFVRMHPGSEPGSHVLLSVTDTGHGMDKKTLIHVFDPFFTTKTVGKGTGLGLASVYGIVKNHGGSIQCYSEPGQGTVFKIYLPAAHGHAPEEMAEPKKTLPEGHGEEKTILVVDDESEIRALTREVLEVLGYKVKNAASGEEALEAYLQEGEKIDLVLLDLNMPGMGGYRCLQELLRVDPLVKVVIASGYSAEGQGRQSLSAGAKGFLGKPYQLRDLETVLREVLGR